MKYLAVYVGQEPGKPLTWFNAEVSIEQFPPTFATIKKLKEMILEQNGKIEWVQIINLIPLADEEDTE